ncbi:hypothetical protein [Crassaminicella indica]|uniref:Uncharacterized protein n=1 Tax=Crassaminicella indica TaxID=2855394 RepID=A0ABX8RGC6_9CLOT|nr:hypothetical protein [Crassaminicella indica]QXM06006.1 hypothetical protein KVH43_11700 [Crassaminicella indica]
MSSFDFSALRKEDSLDVITVTLPFHATYEHFMLFLKKIREYKRKIIINTININNMTNEKLSGIIILDFYSLHNEQYKDENFTVLYKNQAIKENPFEHFKAYDEKLNKNCIEEKITHSKTILKKLLYGFESSNTIFVGNPKEITGKLCKDYVSKEGKYSLIISYDFFKPRKKNQGNILLDAERILLKKPVENIGVWVYAFEKSNHKIGIVIIDERAKNYNIYLTNQINWTGWKYLKCNIPSDIVYPTKLQRIYVESSDFDKKLSGKFRFDALEAIYLNTK